MLKEMGERICNRRKALGYTQEQMAEKMDVSIQMISNLERGNKAIKIENLLKISEILQVSTDYILTGIRTEIDGTALFEKIQSLEERDYQAVCNMVDYFVKNK